MTTTPSQPRTNAYGEDSPNQVLDLYLPAPDAAPPQDQVAAADKARRRPGGHPVVVTIHGGAFAFGDRTQELDALPSLLHRGYAVASVDYRLSGEARFPAAVQDVKSAVAYLRTYAAALGLDPTFIAAWGRSAGGYLAAMLGVTSGRPNEFEPQGADSHVEAVIAWYPPTDFSTMDQQLRLHPPTGQGQPVPPHDEATSPESRFLGAPLSTVPDLLARASPITHLGRHPIPPPFFLAAGTQDRMVPHQQALQLHQALQAHGAPAQLHLLEGAGHADERFETELTQPALDWLDNLR